MKRITLGVAITKIDTQSLIIKNLTKKLENLEQELRQIKLKEMQGSKDEGKRVAKAIAMIKKVKSKEVKVSRVSMSEMFGLTLGSINYWCDKVSNNEA